MGSMSTSVSPIQKLWGMGKTAAKGRTLAEIEKLRLEDGGRHRLDKSIVS